MNIADSLTEHARIRADHPAIEDGSEVITYAGLDALVTETAANIQAAGIGAGDVVAIVLPDSANHLITLCALARAGTVILSLSPSLKPRDLTRALAGALVKAVIADAPSPPLARLPYLAIKDVRRRPENSFARLADGVEAEIVDADDHPLPPGEVGLVRFRGDGYPTGYLDDPEATARAFRDGWFYPGDLATLNDQGYLFFKGRADDVINNGGAKFYPIEVETVLLAHPAVSEAAVFAWPHPRLGQTAAACVVTRAPVSKRALQEFCAERLAGYKVPQLIAKLRELPKNPMGKVLKSELKRWLAERRSKRALPVN